MKNKSFKNYPVPKLTRENIQPGAYYSPTEIFENGLVPWVKSLITWREIVNSPKGMEILKPIVRVTRSFKIKGENVLKLLEMIDKGPLEL